MRWSYSDITLYEQCPYAWYLKHTLPRDVRQNNVYGQYGSYMHELLEKYEKGEWLLEEMVEAYTDGYQAAVTLPFPKGSEASVDKYYQQGLDYLLQFEGYEEYDIVAVEYEANFEFGGHQFLGYIDLILKNNAGEILIVDHKSAGKFDRKMYKQLYMYSKPVMDLLSKWPTYLAFNMFRINDTKVETFDPMRFHEVEKWARNVIYKVQDDQEYLANPDYFYCRNICNYREQCPHV